MDNSNPPDKVEIFLGHMFYATVLILSLIVLAECASKLTLLGVILVWTWVIGRLAK